MAHDDFPCLSVDGPRDLGPGDQLVAGLDSWHMADPPVAGQSVLIHDGRVGRPAVVVAVDTHGVRVVLTNPAPDREVGSSPSGEQLVEAFLGAFDEATSRPEAAAADLSHMRLSDLDASGVDVYTDLTHLDEDGRVHALVDTNDYDPARIHPGRIVEAGNAGWHLPCTVHSVQLNIDPIEGRQRVNIALDLPPHLSTVGDGPLPTST